MPTEAVLVCYGCLLTAFTEMFWPLRLSPLDSGRPQTSCYSLPYSPSRRHIFWISPWASLTTLPLDPPRACNELICLCRLDFSIYLFIISICLLHYFVYVGGYVTCMLWLMPWGQRTIRGRLSSPSTRDWSQIVRLGSKYPYLLNHLTGPIYPHDLYFPSLLFKTGSGNYCWLLTYTWW